MSSSTDFQSRVLVWFDTHGRKNLPWQSPKDPYRVWVSEIMLQQTQVATVIDYFDRFMARFPSLKRLAESDLDAVLSLWAGLGYYARARNLHRTAQLLVTEHEGLFPGSLGDLQKLPGIGRSTAGAILSLGMGIRAPILDGNVRRVLARHQTIDGWPGQAGTLQALWQLSEALTPEHRAADFNQAMMDIGALICTPRGPACAQCPLTGSCKAHQQNTQSLYPGRKPPRQMPFRQTFWLVVRTSEGEIYLESRPESGIWGGLLSFPEFQTREQLDAWRGAHLGSHHSAVLLPQRRHTFSHFHLDIFPVLSDIGAVEEALLALPGSFHDLGKTERLPAPISKLLRELAFSNGHPALNLSL